MANHIGFKISRNISIEQWISLFLIHNTCIHTHMYTHFVAHRRDYRYHKLSVLNASAQKESRISYSESFWYCSKIGELFRARRSLRVRDPSFRRRMTPLTPANHSMPSSFSIQLAFSCPYVDCIRETDIRSNDTFNVIDINYILQLFAAFYRKLIE